eukprot:TRINITY_DN8025_c0_g1_i2.p1 TRINITY_DN8025_c0_g1~~TRINITY_DN8025_c0_g1_i2.p1  ORF type:complete len:351 (+),score=46.22 TRINITY_DN8025_c0_g1_i2:159-1211(+)
MEQSHTVVEPESDLSLGNKFQINCSPIYNGNYHLIPTHPADYFKAGHSASVIKNDVFIYGGYCGPNEMYVLRNAHKLGTDNSEDEDVQWEKEIVEGMSGRAGHSSWIMNDKIYMYGGYNDGAHFLSDMYEVDPTTFRAKRIHYQHTNEVHNLDRRWHCSFFKDNKFFVHGGWNQNPLDDFNVLDWESKKWSNLTFDETNKPSARRWHSLTQLPGNSNQFLLYGGYDGNFQSPLADMHLLDLEHQKWIPQTPKGQVPSTGRCRHAVIPIDNKQMIFIGGYKNDKRVSKTVDILHTDDMTWTSLDDIGSLFPIFRAGMQIVKVNEFGYLIAGGIVRNFVEPFYFMDIRKLVL